MSEPAIGITALAQVQAGDCVVLVTHGWDEWNYSRVRVERVTEKMIGVANARFWRVTGRRVGQDTWHAQYIRALVPENESYYQESLAKTKARTHYNNLLVRVRAKNWRDCSDVQLEEVVALLDRWEAGNDG